jgi:hypothetical protein
VTRVQLAWVLAIQASQISGRSWPRLLTRNLRADLGGRRLAFRDRPRSWEVSERRLRTNGERVLTTCSCQEAVGALLRQLPRVDDRTLPTSPFGEARTMISPLLEIKLSCLLDQVPSDGGSEEIGL